MVIGWPMLHIIPLSVKFATYYKLCTYLLLQSFRQRRHLCLKYMGLNINLYESLLNKVLKQLKESFLWSGYPNYIIEKYVDICIKQKRENLQKCSLDVPRKQIYFGFQYINESSVKFVQNISKLISKNFNYSILSVFRTSKKEEIYSRTSHQKLKDLTKIHLNRI